MFAVVAAVRQDVVKMDKKFIPITFGPGARDLDDVIGKMEFALGINPKADLVYKLLTQHPELIKEFGVEYIEHPDGRCELLGVAMISGKNDHKRIATK
jgi:hypothetical protein